MSTYGSLQGSFSSFSDDEKLNYSLKIALSRLQTDLGADWFNEPTDFIPKQPLELYKNVIPTYKSVQNFLLIDPDVDGNGTEMVTNKTVGDILSVASNGSQFTLDDILNTSKVRDPSQYSTLSDSDFVDGASRTQIKLLGRNMFTRYKYWLSGLTGKNSLLEGGPKNGSGGANTGTTPDAKEPFNAYITYTDSGDLSPERRWSVINGASETSKHKEFYNKLISEGVELNIIDPNLKSDLTKKHPFLKLCLQVLTYTTRGTAPITQSDNTSSSGSVNKTDNIGFHNPLMEKALGDTNGFLSGAGYQIAGWNGSSWKSVTTSYGTPGYQNILYFVSNPGFILVYGQKNIDYGYFTSRSHPPMITFLKYTGETFSDGIISQGDTLPAIEVSNPKDLFINTTENTIHRLADNNGTKEWIGIGGTGGGSFMPVGEDLSVSGNIYYNAGNVGIGTTNPEAKLHVHGDIKLENGNRPNISKIIFEPSYYIYSGQSTTSGAVGEIQFRNQKTDKITYIQGYVFSGDHISSIKFIGKTAWNGSIIDILTLRGQSGKVGIGTNSPVEKLHINGWIGRTAHNNGALCGSYNNIGENSKKTNPIYVIGSSYKPGDSSLSNMYGIGYSHSNAGFLGGSGWGMYVAADGDARVFLNASSGGKSYINSGNVGIGTTSPICKLDVRGSICANNDTDTTSYIGRAAVGFCGYGNHMSIAHYDCNTTVSYALLQSEGGETYLNCALGRNIYFRENDSTKMFIKSGGNVGIGTTSPHCKLDVRGTICANNDTDTTSYFGRAAVGYCGHSNYMSIAHYLHNTAGSYALLQSEGGETYLNCALGRNINFRENNSTKMILKGGKFGIGTTGPGGKLHVAFGNWQNSGIIQKWTYNSTRYVHLCCPATNNVSDAFIFHTPNAFHFKVDSTTGIYIKDNANVGIGTTSPVEKLHINGWIGRTAHNNGALCGSYTDIGNNSTKTNPIYVIGRNYKPGDSSLSDMYGIGYSHSNAAFLGGSGWGMYVAADGDARVFLNASSGGKSYINSGYVGIGTSSPSYPLHINASISGAAKSEEYLNEGTFINTNLATGDTFAGGSKLHKKEWVIMSHISGSGTDISLYTNQGIFTDHIVFHSDERIKQDIVLANDNACLNKLRKIETYWYDYIVPTKRTEHKVLGFIAQQVRAELPEAVSLGFEYLPNELRFIEICTWENIIVNKENVIVDSDIFDDKGERLTKDKFKLTILDISDNSGNIPFKFSVGNDPSGNDAKEFISRSLKNDCKSFIFDNKYDYVFLYGNMVYDYHRLDKNRLFALNFSATQEIDRIQQQEKTKLEQAQALIDDLLLENDEINEKLNTANTKITNLETQLTSLLERVLVLENN